MNKSAIEDTARDLQIYTWNRRAELWPDREPGLFEIPNPEIAAHILGIGFEYRESLGRFGYRGAHFEVAGQLNRAARKISISRKFPSDVMRFTGAHEIGHWIMHPGEHMHRDRPIRGLEANTTKKRPAVEQEADHFAACYLMPGKLVTRTFERLFGTRNFTFTEAIAFHLSPSDMDSLLRPHENSLARELALATARSFNGIHFKPLTEQFGVSATTMAIRIKELDLVRV